MPLSSPRFKAVPRLEQAANNQPVLKYGETSHSVAVIQQALVDAGIPMPISFGKKGAADGIFKGETKRAVKQLQRLEPGSVADDGIVGRQTMAKLDVMFKSGSTPAPVPKPEVAVNLSPNKVQREQEIMAYLVGQGLTLPKARGWSKILSGFNVARGGIAMIALGEGTLSAAAATGALGFASALTGVFMFWGGCLIALTNAMETAYRIAANLGFLYGLTAWAFDHGRPTFSKCLLKSIVREGRQGEYPKFLNHWTRGVSKAFEVAPQGRHRIGTANGKPMQVDAYKVLLRDYGSNLPGRFSLRFSTIIANGISNHLERKSFAASVDSGCQYPY